MSNMTNMTNISNDLNYINSLDDIKHVYYINLDSRPDRNQNAISQLNKIGLVGKRFNAIKHSRGAIGCTMSHLEVLKIAKKDEHEHVLICEDDIYFTNHILFINQINKFLSLHKDDWDVVLFCGNNNGDFTVIDDTCVKVSNSQTSTGYLVKKPYYETLIHNVEIGLENLLRNPSEERKYAIDQYWTRIQTANNWYLITPLSVTQKASFSNIEGRFVNYSNELLVLDKKAKRQSNMMNMNTKMNVGMNIGMNMRMNIGMNMRMNIGKNYDREFMKNTLKYTI
jgi:GR25 family glycosyltransferase involved in LPS biosynthesis